MTDFLQRLRQRKLVQWALAYLAAAWVLLQVLDLVSERFGWPDGLMRGCLVAAGIGFFVTLLLAWYHGDRGEQRVSGVELLLLALVLTAGGGLLWKFAGVPEAASTNAAVANGVTPGIAADVADIHEKSVAVLPFVAMSSGPDDGYFADGLTEEIINALATLPDLLVTARTSAFHFKGTKTAIPEIARTLGVAHVVEGSVRRSGDQVRITAQLIRAEDGFHLWSETYDRPAGDVFAVQTAIAEHIAHAMGVLLDEQKRAAMADVGIRDVEVFLAFQRGNTLYQQAHGEMPMVPTLMRANAEFDAAIARKPDFAQAYLQRSDLYAHMLFGDSGSFDTGLTQHEALKRLHSNLEAGIKYETDRGQRLVIETVRTFLSRDWHGLGAKLDHAYETWHNCRAGVWMDPMGVAFQRIESTYARNMERTHCDPLNHLYWSTVMDNATLLGRPQESLRLGREAESIIGGRRRYIQDALINANLALGRIEDAETVLGQGESGDGSSALRIDAAAGRAGKWDAWRTSLQDDHRDRLLAAAVFGDREEANRIAAAVDRHPLGAAELARMAYLCLCGAPFDLSATPNFARQLKQGDLPWPPKTSINWPLKDWP